MINELGCEGKDAHRAINSAQCILQRPSVFKAPWIVCVCSLEAAGRDYGHPEAGNSAVIWKVWGLTP